MYTEGPQSICPRGEAKGQNLVQLRKIDLPHTHTRAVVIVVRPLIGIGAIAEGASGGRAREGGN